MPSGLIGLPHNQFFYKNIAANVTCMNIIIFLVVTVGFALTLDIFFASFGGVFLPPLTIVIAYYWFWRLTFSQRIVLAFCLGLLLDVIGFLPMGTHTLTLICMAYICELMKSFFANNKSRAVIIINGVIFMIIFRSLIVLIAPLVRFSQILL